MTADGWTIGDADVVVVVGSMRTGTTLVAELLDSHPDVTYLGFELSEEWSDWTGLPWGAPGADDVSCPPVGVAEATPERIAAARDGVTRLLRDAAPTDPDARPGTVVLKNPHVWHRLPFLCAVLPGARVVRTRRDRRATVASLRRLWDRALDQHGRVHHLPEDPDRCWDFVPAADAGAYDPLRTFPGGDVGVLAEFHRRVERCLDRFADDHPGRIVAEVAQEDLVRDFAATTSGLLAALDLPPASLVPPEPLDPDRLDEWRDLLTQDEQERIGTVG
ncbi:MAG: sulfotransferase [Actinobacteria bacterium]|nr:sulfotransferase [Actinomycetota bacterium]